VAKAPTPAELVDAALAELLAELAELAAELEAAELTELTALVPELVADDAFDSPEDVAEAATLFALVM